MELTARQQQIIDIYRSHALAGRPAPTVRELARLIGLSSTCTVQHHVNALQAKGLLTDAGHKARGRVLVSQVSPLQAMAHWWSRATDEEKRQFAASAFIVQEVRAMTGAVSTLEYNE
jgi:SOS-response transcriptional repressor LexA